MRRSKRLAGRRELDESPAVALSGAQPNWEYSTEDEAVADLKEALRAYVEAFGLDDTLSRINAPSGIRELDVELHELVGA